MCILYIDNINNLFPTMWIMWIHMIWTMWIMIFEKATTSEWSL